MTTVKPIPIESMKEYLRYDNGALFWDKKPSAKVYVGDRAGRYEKNGYRSIWFDNKKYAEHRIIWALFNGDTQLVIDHKSGDNTDNRIENLRAVSLSVNTRNQARKNIGVTRSGNKWVVSRQIEAKGKQVYFGLYEDLELASLVSSAITEKYFADVYHR